MKQTLEDKRTLCRSKSLIIKTAFEVGLHLTGFNYGGTFDVKKEAVPQLKGPKRKRLDAPSVSALTTKQPKSLGQKSLETWRIFGGLDGLR